MRRGGGPLLLAHAGRALLLRGAGAVGGGGGGGAGGGAPAPWGAGAGGGTRGLSTPSAPPAGRDRIMLRGLVFFGYHGALPEETRLGQRFRVDVDLRMDLSRAGRSDDLRDTVNYAEVWGIAKRVVEGPPQQLIESVAERVAGAVLGEHPEVAEVTVTVHKPSVPIPGPLDEVAVEVTRGR